MIQVILGGLVTSLLTLAAVWTVEGRGVTVMGWYLDYVIPIGGLGVGLAASSGYGVASWLRGVKISGRLLAVIFAIQVGVYFAASWIQYATYSPVYPDGTPVSFATFFDATTRAFAFAGKDGKGGTPYGVFGYFFRALEVGGFCLGSLIAPFALKGRAYCDSCSLYMRGAKSAMLAASVPFAKAKKGDAQAAALHEAAQRAAYEQAIAALDALHGLAEANDASGFRDRVKEVEVPGRAAQKLPQRIAVALSRCPRCESGEMRTTLWSGHGQQQRSRELGRSALAQFFARNVAG
jgi:hypothetical protein